MTTRVRFCLSYDCFKWGFIALKDDIISIENITLSRTASWRYAPVTKFYVTCGHTIFMTWRYPLILTQRAYIGNGEKSCFIQQQIHWAETRDII